MSEPIYVFPSNLAGRHGKGLALIALQRHGARYGDGVGPSGNSYAIPTKGIAPQKNKPMPVLPLSEIKEYVDRFIIYAATHPEITFEVTAIGCGNAGFTPKQIAPMFALAPGNCKLPDEFNEILHERKKHFDR